MRRALVGSSARRLIAFDALPSTTRLAATRAICSTQQSRAPPFWFGGNSKRLSSGSAFPALPHQTPFGQTDDEILQFMRESHTHYNNGRPPTDPDMLHWKPSIHA